MKCPRCSGFLFLERALPWRPEHFSCVNCGNYIERPIQDVMPIPPVEVDYVKQAAAARAAKSARRALRAA